VGVPEVVKRAVVSRASAGVRSVAPAPTQEVERGDLRLITPPYAGDSPARLGLVLEVGVDGKTVEIALTHSSPDLATAFDGIVSGAVSGTSYPVVVESDLRGVVWIGQVAARVGHLAPRVLEAVSRLVGGDDVVGVEGVDVGTRLLGPTDRRWAFKEAEGAALDALCSDCSTELLRGREPWLMGRELLVPQMLTQMDSLDEVLEELGHWLNTRDVRIDLDTALWLEEAGALEVSTWLDVGLDLDLYEAVVFAIEAAITRSGPGPESWNRSLRGPEVEDEEAAQYQLVHVLGRRAGMVTE
jgi:hypothetical protein